MADRTPPDRDNQRYRTRKDLLQTAGLLMKTGRKPSLEDVADAARVSRATVTAISRGRSTVVEAALDIKVPDDGAVFMDDNSKDPVERAVKAEAAMHRSVYENEAEISLMLASAVVKPVRVGEAEAAPVRQNRRSPLIEAALAPTRDQFDPESYARLTAALALIFGLEAMIVFRNVLYLDEEPAGDIKSWTVHALVRAALAEQRKVLGATA